MKIPNYWGVTFNLNDGTYKRYTKPNNEIKYRHKDSHHSPSATIHRIKVIHPIF